LLLPLTGAVLLGVALGSYLPYLPLSILSLLVLVSVVLMLAERHGRLTTRTGSLFYAGLLSGVLLWPAFVWNGQGGFFEEPDAPQSVTGTVLESPAHAPARTVLILGDVHVGQESGTRALPGRLRVAWRDPDRDFSPGDRVALTGRVHPPSRTVNPGGFDYGAYLRQQGIDAVVSVSGPGRVALVAAPAGVSRWTGWRMVEEWRSRIRHAALASLRDSAQGIYLGLVTGEQGYVTQEVRDVFMATGTVHILSISGSHLGLVAVLSFGFVKGLCRLLPAAWLLALSRRVTPTRLAAGVTFALVVFYTALAGAEIATVRSLVMLALFLLAVWLGRTQDLLRAVACAAVLLVAHNPRALFDISFQLSYAAVFAIALVLRLRGERDADGLPPVREPALEAAGRWARDYARLTGSVTLATLPLVAYYFKQIAWLGLAANAVVVPFAGFVLVPLGLSSSVWLLLTGQEALPAARLNQALLESMADGVAWLATMPGAEWHVASPSVLSMGVYYALLLALGLPAAWARDRWRWWGCALGVAVLVLWWNWPARNGSDGDAFRVTFLDVGQGDACLLELPDGQTVLIDAGAKYDTLDMGRAVVGPYLWERGIRRLDHVIATHPQLDHVGGLPWILRSFEIGRYWSNGVTRDEPFYRRLQEAVSARGLTEERAEEGRAIIERGPCRLDVMNPPASAVRKRSEGAFEDSPGGQALNNLSIVIRQECGPHSFLFAADVEREALERMQAGGGATDVTVVKVPHHGAASSLSEAWIHVLHAREAVVSAGARNAYGHPVPAVVNTYEQAGARVWRTDREGAVWAEGRISQPGVTVHTAREAQVRPLEIDRSLWQAEIKNLALVFRQWAKWPDA
jgi:competence protein ComEC